MDIREQAQKVQQELGIPTTQLCKRLKISPSGYYRWLKRDLKLSEETEERIRKYVSKLSALL